MLIKQNDSLKFSSVGTAESFRFISDATAEKYAMLSSTNQYVGMNVNTSCVQLSEKAAYVNLEAVDAPNMLHLQVLTSVWLITTMLWR